MKLISMPGYMIRAAKQDVKRARSQWPVGVVCCGFIAVGLLFFAWVW